jgi:hypothetical protein
MCEFCEGQRRERVKAEKELRRDISLLANGELPSDTDYPQNCDTERDHEQYRMEILIARAALLIASTSESSPTMVLGELAGTMFVAEAETRIEHELLREQMSRDAFLN